MVVPLILFEDHFQFPKVHIRVENSLFVMVEEIVEIPCEHQIHELSSLLQFITQI